MRATHDMARSEPKEFGQLTVADIMEPDVQCGHPSTTAEVLGSLMIEGFGGVPIVDEKRKLLGIVTEFDLLAALERANKLGDLKAQEIMTTEVVRVSPQTDLRTLMYVLQTNHLIRVPVVDQEGTLIGIVARRDVVRGYLSATP
ncbi:MAG: CBS domain-containing protein [Nitrospira sp.]|jgi:CBS-domain-containing membrane protein|nr:CBS domain-containing protein [Nitrospira sp.]